MKLVSPEALSELQRTILEGYSRFLPAGAVCVNVMLGDAPWDVRPLALLLGKLSIARFSMTLGEAAARQIASHVEGCSVLCSTQQRVQLLPGEGRFMLLRPYYPETLKEELEKGLVSGTQQRLAIVQALIRRVAELGRRGVAHGHICPANIVRDGSGVDLLDPVLGALHQTPDSYLAPDTTAGKAPEPAADLYGLGKVTALLLGDTISGRQRAVIEQLLLPTPRQRPPLEEVSLTFGVTDSSAAQASGTSDSRSTRMQTSSGRLVKPGGAAHQESAHQSAQGEAAQLHKEPLVDRAPKTGNALAPLLLVGGAALAAGIWVVKDRYPALYFELASRVPMLASQHSAEYEEDWASRDRARMAVVGRAGVIRREPAAINTIVNDLAAGANPVGVHGALMRVALDDGWRHELTPADKHAALVFALEGLVPEGRAQMPPLDGLHPGVVLAVLGQIQFTSMPAELQQLPIDTLVRLPAPFGDLFAQVKAMGVSRLGDATAKGLAEIVTGTTTAQVFERFFGSEQQAARTLARVSLILPIVTANEPAATELLAALGEREGEITTLVHWFSLVDLAGWASAKAADKVAIILGTLPQSKLPVAQLADLLTFPVEAVRNQAVLQLREFFPGPMGERLLVTLQTPANGLTREQSISLVSALALPAEARTPFIPAWFNLSPSANAVVLILLARSDADAHDVFNLEAARYLRRTPWTATTDILKLLASHPEPLARVLAYGRLDPSVDEGRSILLERQRVEKDESCLKVLQERLMNYPRSGS